MCAKHGLWEPEQIPTLLYLWSLAAGGGGYEVRGVRGWAHRVDVEAGIGCSILSLLPLLFRRRLLHRTDVRPPVSERPAWVYRLKDASVRAVAERTGAALGPIPPLHPPGGEPPVFAPRRKYRALLLMRAAHDDPDAPLRFGEPGWVAPRELGIAADRERHGFLAAAEVTTADLRWLLRAGLVERRNAPAPRSGEAAILWRATKMGRRVRLLDWREPGPDGVIRGGAMAAWAAISSG